MRRFADIDLARLPPPDAIETLDYEAILSARIGTFRAHWEAVRAVYPDLPTYDVAVLETDPVVIAAQADAYHELLVRARVNEAVRSVLLATARGTMLDALGARVATQRLVVDPGDPAATPPRARVMEQDDPFRARIQLAYEALSTAGPPGAYVWHALSAHPHVTHAVAIGPEEPEIAEPGEAHVFVLSSQGDGLPTEQVLRSVAVRLAAYEIRPATGDPIVVWDRANARAQSARPLTEKVIVAAPSLVAGSVEAVLKVPYGPDPTIIVAAAEIRLGALLAARRRIGTIVPRSAIFAALHVTDATGAALVEEVELIEPGGDLGGGVNEVVAIGDITISAEVLS